MPLDILDLDTRSLQIDGEDIIIRILPTAKHKFNASNAQSVEMVISAEEDTPIVMVCINYEQQDDEIMPSENFKSYIAELTPDEWFKLSYSVLQMVALKNAI